jgi:DNA mismatch repair protein MutS
VLAPEPLPSARRLLQEAVVDEPRPLPRGSRGASETGFIRPGFRAELDALREAAHKGREWIAGLEARERERSGISTLAVLPARVRVRWRQQEPLARVPSDYETSRLRVWAFTTRAARDGR